MSDESEKKISSFNTTEEIRKAVQENPEDFEDSVEPVKVLMSLVLQCLSLKEKSFLLFPAARTHKMKAFFSKLCDIDADLTQADRSHYGVWER